MSCFAIIQKAEESLYGLRGIIFTEQMYTHIRKESQEVSISDTCATCAVCIVLTMRMTTYTG